MEQALLIVWRESVEALLVVGLLYAWLKRQHEGREQIRLLWLGVGGGLALAGLLGILMMVAGHWMSGPAGEWFQAGMSALAALLIVQMVVWMHHHGRELRHDLESRAAQALAHGRNTALALLAALAVAREGSEIAIFLYGAGASSDSTSILIGALLGLLLGGASFALLQAGSKLIDWRRFFAISEFILLMLGGAMLMAALDRASSQLMALDLPEAAYNWLGDPLWSTVALLDDGSRFGSLIASLTGYRAQPSLAAVVLLVGFWLISKWLLRSPKPVAVAHSA